MTRAEFEKEVLNYGPGHVYTLTADRYALIEKVYNFHPSISETRGKAQVAMLYVEFGIQVFHDMEPTAEMAMKLESDIRATRHELNTLLDRYHDLKKGGL